MEIAILKEEIERYERQWQAVAGAKPTRGKNLHEKIYLYFNMDELMQMAFDLGIEWNDLIGDSKKAKVRELVGLFQRESRLYALVDYCQQKRGNVDWTGLG